MPSNPGSLASFVAAVESGASPDDALRSLQFRLTGEETVVRGPYLAPVGRRGRLQRGPAALLCDTAARACADAQGVGTRRAVLAAHAMRERRAFQRLGYRSDADYAREQLGISARAFRDLARLGGRLDRLPRSKAAFLKGELTRTQADVVAAVATPDDEAEWLERARSETVRGLKAAARQARRAAHRRAGDLPEDGEGSRRRRTFDVPAAMLGKIDAVLELTARVAGAPMPAGTLWEFIAAEYLSGAPLPACAGDSPAGGGKRQPRGVHEMPDESTRTALQLRRAASPEDPRGYQRVLERESRNWSFLPTARPRLELHGDWKRLRPAGEEEEGEGRQRRTPWELHRELRDALAAESRVAWQLGRLLTIIRNRRLWRTMCFASFSHYVRERLGISPRAADRLVRIDRAMWSYPPLQRAYHAGELSPLVADTLVRLLRYIQPDDDIRQAWIDFAASVTFEHLSGVVRGVERLRAEQPIGQRRWLGSPAQVEAALASKPAGPPMFVAHAEAAVADSPMFATGAGTAVSDSPVLAAGRDGVPYDSPMFVTCSYAVWMTEDEHGTLETAMEAVRRASAAGRPEVPDAACLNVLLDHFIAVYDDASARAMRRRYAVFERDGWRCRVPGCSAYGPLQAHHIVFRAHGGSDDPDNLVTLCDFHHKALHDRWIRCVGRAPDALYWELGMGTGAAPCEAPVARVAGHRRLGDDEYWDGFQVLWVTSDRGCVA